MNVNFWGAVNTAEAFQSQLLEHKSRLIVIGSDCADYPLPGFAIYSASKAALQSWATALRLEVGKYGVTVVTFQPGSFPLQSRLLFGLTKQFAGMKAKLEQKNLAEFYGSTLEQFSKHFSSLFNEVTPPIAPLDNDCLRKALLSVLEDDMSKTPVYIYESAGQAIFHMMISTLPRWISDALILKVLNSPKWKREENKIK
ncbi:unnamed protein product [Allacma fusca]|uniref:Uncharacterized protein n=1 Tax=Allacma fusca TaxID=39272 RepID=A0A8J2KS85_9HEXA|nr:unnamed protein product [Allacma fusca]